MRSIQEIEEIRAQLDAVPHWYHCFDFGDGLVTSGARDSAALLNWLALPERMDGMRVLDIGTRDGYFAFVCEARGARQVIGIDYVPCSQTGFMVARDILKSTRVQYIQENIYHISPAQYGTFDLVLFLGVLYHLPDPLGALEIIHALTNGYAFIETHAIDHAVLMPDGSFASLPATLMDVPLAQFYPGASLNGDPSNFWAPNGAGLRALLTEVGFAVDRLEIRGDRAVACGIATPEDIVTEYQRQIARGRLEIL